MLLPEIGRLHWIVAEMIQLSLGALGVGLDPQSGSDGERALERNLISQHPSGLTAHLQIPVGRQRDPIGIEGHHRRPPYHARLA